MDRNGSRNRRRSSVTVDDDTASRRNNFYRRESNMSENRVSFLSNVGMANDEIFSGPMSESVPTANSSFAHRRSRADSTTSFTYYDDQDEDRDISDEEWLQEEAIIDEEAELEEGRVDAEDGHAFAEPDMDLESN
ncbi:hypothetical protein KCU68_g20462, partial [Aureobasidium melanogenum]